MTKSQAEALAWLNKHNGTGVFDRNGVLMAGGETAPVMRSTWNALRDSGHITINQKRVTVTNVPRAS